MKAFIFGFIRWQKFYHKSSLWKLMCISNQYAPSMAKSQRCSRSVVPKSWPQLDGKHHYKHSRQDWSSPNPLRLNGDHLSHGQIFWQALSTCIQGYWLVTNKDVTWCFFMNHRPCVSSLLVYWYWLQEMEWRANQNVTLVSLDVPWKH